MFSFLLGFFFQQAIKHWHDEPLGSHVHQYNRWMVRQGSVVVSLYAELIEVLWLHLFLRIRLLIGFYFYIFVCKLLFLIFVLYESPLHFYLIIQGGWDSGGRMGDTLMAVMTYNRLMQDPAVPRFNAAQSVARQQSINACGYLHSTNSIPFKSTSSSFSLLSFPHSWVISYKVISI